MTGRLLATQPDSQFWSQSSVRYTQIVFLMEVFIIFVLAATILYLFAFIKRRARFFLDQSIQLEKEVTRRTEKARSDMQKKMYAAARLSSLGEVSAGISHEINNPLFIIKSLAMLLKKLSTEKSQSTDKYVEIADKMNTVVDRISKNHQRLEKIISR